MIAGERTHRLGWVGTGRMGSALVERLLARGCDVSVYNRTREKAEPLERLGAKVVASPADLAERDIVFTTVGGDADFEEVVVGAHGILSRGSPVPRVVVDSSTVSRTVAAAVRRSAEALGCEIVAAPVSGNPKVVHAGRLTVVASGPRTAFDVVAPYLAMYGTGVTYVGEGDVARLVKICHNLFLAIVAQGLAETAILAEKAGVSRADYMTFMNDSALGSMFTRYKTPAIVNLDFTPTFTGHLLRKDLQLGLEAGRESDVPLPVSAIVHEIVSALVGSGLGEVDFMSLLELEARNAGITLTSEDVDMGDGLEERSG